MIGRQFETKEMQNLLTDKKSHLVMVTGRRRVGKTYLINEAYKSNMLFSFTGTKGDSMENQLLKFSTKLNDYAKKENVYSNSNWFEALHNLQLFIQGRRKTNKKLVVFFDEFPWINTENSGFVNEFGYWWNNFAVNANIIVVISGSATTWMIKKIINNRGNLHGRVTRRIHLHPFTLHETKLFIKAKNPQLSNYDILQLYMAMGGIPLYLDQIKAGESATQSIYNICFKKSGLLHKEFNDLFESLFDNYEKHIAVIRSLSTKWTGLTRSEIIKKSKLTDGGSLKRVLDDLESCNFVLPVYPLQNKKKGTLYRLADEYCRFYLEFIEDASISTMNNWLSFQAASNTYKAWQGYAFESICIKHAEGIKEKLQIAGISSNVYSYFFSGTNEVKGFQIDMLIDRNDNVINLCEIKFLNKPLTITKQLGDSMRIKRAGFIEQTGTQKAVFNTLITTYGINRAQYQGGEIDTDITMESIFALDHFE